MTRAQQTTILVVAMLFCMAAFFGFQAHRQNAEAARLGNPSQCWTSACRDTAMDKVRARLNSGYISSY